MALQRPFGSIGIIGGGISGLSCAQRLEQRGFTDITVYDTGKRAVGGRASSRRWPIQGNAEDFLAVDHAAQFFLAKDLEFREHVEQWARAGVVQPWSNNALGVLEIAEDEESPFRFTSFATLDKEKKEEEEQLQSIPTRWIGNSEHGLGSVAKHLARTLQHTRLVTDAWVAPSKGLRWNKGDGSWSVRVAGTEIGRHDSVIIAHNGKCAHRISSLTPAKALHKLLDVRFNDRVEPRNNGVMTLNSVYSLVVELDKKPSSFQGASVLGSPILSFLGSNTHKYGMMLSESESGATRTHTEVWTLLSTATFAKRHKVPQEHLEGTETSIKVTNAMLTEAKRLWNVTRSPDSEGPHHKTADKECIVVRASKLQLWGAGVPLNVWRGTIPSQGEKGERSFTTASTAVSKCVWDAEYRIGAVGDWLCDPSIEGAWLSGTALADHLGTYSIAGIESSSSLALSAGTFESVDSGSLGSVAVAKKKKSSGNINHMRAQHQLNRPKNRNYKPRNRNVRQGDWTCPNCAAHVFASKTACYKCRTPKPNTIKPPRTGTGP